MTNFLKISLVVSFIFLISIATLANDGKYEFTIDLTNVVDDKVFVSLDPPSIKENEVIFYMPKIIPGTYAIEDYGRFVSDIKALDKKGRELEIVKLTDNSWRIRKAKKLRKLTYWIEDSYDTELEGPEILQPAGTNIEANKNFVLNAGGFCGYFNERKENEFNVKFIKPTNFYGATGLVPVATNASTDDNDKRVDHFRTTNYDELVDSPIMYSEPDTTIINVAGTEVLVASYSPNKMVTAKEIAATIEEVLMAQYEYLDKNLPVDKYAFIFYFTDQPVMSYGALEHSYSSYYYMPEMPINKMNQQLRDFVAHEFFHIVTPLNIHSEEIHRFDFNDPKMSRHLWLYEGMTEYFAGNCQVKGKLIEPSDYLDMLRGKLITSLQFYDTLPFTQLSLGALDQYADQYYNVYMKGALIGMALDIKLRKQSNGAYGVQKLMLDLSKEYGKDKAFQDADLFDKISELTNPEIKTFLSTYVGGSTPLPYDEIFNSVGINYTPIEVFKGFSMGIEQHNFGINMETREIYIQQADNLNAFGQALELQENDVLLKFNDIDLPPLGPEIQGYFSNVMDAFEEGKEYSITVSRKDENNEAKEVRLAVNTFKIDLQREHGISVNQQATEEQVFLRNAWLGL